ncbi:hypothetical protein [Halolamina sp.]|jgi:hypothetical protein|uniref:hypothetical protein n=1 Tax=Halolamina sp. TaxID=1940283 RepID=UPI000223BB7D|nr:hypothetical protein Halar_3667 [halophilic archaeon DL31]
MTQHTGRTALLAALSDWRRNAAALLGLVAVFVAAAFVGTREAYYLAALVGFTIWMVWFVLTGIDWVSLAEF